MLSFGECFQFDVHSSNVFTSKSVKDAPKEDLPEDEKDKQ